ncbi:MAG TPA: ATP-binding cassette domain-containing protein [Dongiaceae bacterium]|nr:ATP-binding cassette domain-containing protein [Dongiaceae bacterium]
MSKLAFENVSYWHGDDRAKAATLDKVSLQIESGKILGLVGESGCGKSTLARLGVGLLVCGDGAIRFDGVDIKHLRGSGLHGFRRQVQLVFQDPVSALNPRSTVRRLLKEPLSLHNIVPASEMDGEISRLLQLVGLDAGFSARWPQELSGGQRQRVAIARAIALRPALLICDEPVSSLDVSVRTQILKLLLGLRRDTGMGLLFISHDLSVVRQIADNVVVMQHGSIVERGSVTDVWSNPQHPYTRQLLAAVPRGQPSIKRRQHATETAE